jgi:hypothetical protein
MRTKLSPPISQTKLLRRKAHPSGKQFIIESYNLKVPKKTGAK